MPEAASTRLGLIAPSGTDSIALGDNQIRAIVAQLETVDAAFEQGTSRPAAAAALQGYFYVNTSTGLVSYCTGSAWLDFQPYDSDLVAIAALSTTSYGRSILEAANASALRTLAGLVIGTDVQAHDADLDNIAALATTSYGRSLLTAAAAANLPGGEIGYDEITTPVNVTVAFGGGSDAGTTVLSCAAHTFDGAPVIARFFAPYVAPAVAASSAIVIALYEGATEIGRLCQVQQAVSGGATGTLVAPVPGELRFTPSAGSHSYTVFATQTGGTGTIGAGPAGANQYGPAFVRFTKV